MFVVRGGKLAGADLLGARYDGTIETRDGENSKVKMLAFLPGNLPTIQGGVTPPQGESFEMQFEMRENFLSEQYVRIETDRGPVNAKFIRIRGLDD